MNDKLSFRTTAPIGGRRTVHKPFDWIQNLSYIPGVKVRGDGSDSKSNGAD